MGDALQQTGPVDVKLGLKERILEELHKALKQVQLHSVSRSLDSSAWPVQGLCHHLDHALLHGLRQLQHGYWPFVRDFTHRDTRHGIESLQVVRTSLGRGRAWLYITLNESSLESYLQSFVNNPRLVEKHYSRQALLRDAYHTHQFLALSARLAQISFSLNTDATYLDVSVCPLTSRRSPSDDGSLSQHSLTSSLPSPGEADSGIAFPDSDLEAAVAAEAMESSGLDPWTEAEEGGKEDTEVEDNRINRLLAIGLGDVDDSGTNLEVVHIGAKVVRRKKKSRSHLQGESDQWQSSGSGDSLGESDTSCPETGNKSSGSDICSCPAHPVNKLLEETRRQLKGCQLQCEVSLQQKVIHSSAATEQGWSTPSARPDVNSSDQESGGVSAEQRADCLPAGLLFSGEAMESDPVMTASDIVNQNVEDCDVSVYESERCIATKGNVRHISSARIMTPGRPGENLVSKSVNRNGQTNTVVLRKRKADGQGVKGMCFSADFEASRHFTVNFRAPRCESDLSSGNTRNSWCCPDTSQDRLSACAAAAISGLHPQQKDRYSWCGSETNKDSLASAWPTFYNSHSVAGHNHKKHRDSWGPETSADRSVTFSSAVCKAPQDPSKTRYSWSGPGDWQDMAGNRQKKPEAAQEGNRSAVKDSALHLHTLSCNRKQDRNSWCAPERPAAVNANDQTLTVQSLQNAEKEKSRNIWCASEGLVDVTATEQTVTVQSSQILPKEKSRNRNSWCAPEASKNAFEKSSVSCSGLCSPNTGRGQSQLWLKPPLAEREGPDGQEDPPISTSMLALQSQASGCLPQQKEVQSSVAEKHNFNYNRAFCKPKLINPKLEILQYISGNGPKSKTVLLSKKRQLRRGKSILTETSRKTVLAADAQKTPLYIPGVKVEQDRRLEMLAELASEVAQGQAGRPGRSDRVDNNLLLMLMLEVFQSEEEHFYKLFRVSRGHTEGSWEPLLAVLTDVGIYLLGSGIGGSTFTTHFALSYSDLDVIVLDPHYKSVKLLSQDRNSKFLVTVGDASVSHSLVSHLELMMRRLSWKPQLPAVLISQQQMAGLAAWAHEETNNKNEEILYYCLAHLEDEHPSPPSTPLGPSREGHLMFRLTSVLPLCAWKPGYFILKAGVLYQFNVKEDRIPKLVLPLTGGHCVGCRRFLSSTRPHTFEILLGDMGELQMAAPNEYDASDWLQSFVQTISLGVVDPDIPQLTSCTVALSSRHILAFHEEEVSCFRRMLSLAAVCDLLCVLVFDEVKTCCILEFSCAEVKDSSGDWILYFRSKEEKDMFVHNLGQLWSSVHQQPVTIQELENESLKQKCHENSLYLQMAWERLLQLLPSPTRSPSAAAPPHHSM